MEYSYELKIPKERVPVLIGVKGKVKRKIEKETQTEIIVDSIEGVVVVSGDDALPLLTAREIIKAIGRGFNPVIALSLLKQDNMFELIDLSEVSRNKNDEHRLKGRIIGEDGKSRRTVETLTETEIVVYGKTVGIIGEVENVQLAKRAISMLIEGSRHATVYGFLEKQRRLLREPKFEEFNN